MIEFRTSWSKETPPYGAFDDFVIIEATETNERILIRPEEFSFLTEQLHDNWTLGKSKYIQLLKEWNECIGFNDVEEIPSILIDNDETIKAITEVKGTDKLEYLKLTNEDLKLILGFLVRNRYKKLKIWKE